VRRMRLRRVRRGFCLATPNHVLLCLMPDLLLTRCYKSCFELDWLLDVNSV
jgi:hypothetical protein